MTAVTRVAGMFAGRRGRERAIVVALLAVAIAYPFFVKAATREIPILRDLPVPTLNTLIVMFYYAILALGLNIVVGFAGLLDLGYVAFYVFGAYTTAFLASPLFNVHVSWWLVVWLAVGVAALAGVLLGAPTLKLRGDYLAIVTLGFGEIMPKLVLKLDNVNVQLPDGSYLIGPDFNLTGGGIGVNPIDPPTLPIAGPWGDVLKFSNLNPAASFYLVLVLLALVFFVCIRLRDSRLGRAWMAIREDETAAEAMGINTVTTKLLAFALGASFSGFTGAFFGAYSTAIFPESFSFTVSISILIMIILGGMGSLRGVVLGAFVIQYLNQAFLPFLGKFVDPPVQAFGQANDIGLFENFALTSFNFLIYGIILVIMMIVRPEGLLPSAARKLELHGEGIAADQAIGTASEVTEAVEEYETHGRAGGDSE